MVRIVVPHDLPLEVYGFSSVCLLAPFFVDLGGNLLEAPIDAVLSRFSDFPDWLAPVILGLWRTPIMPTYLVCPDHSIGLFFGLFSGSWCFRMGLGLLGKGLLRLVLLLYLLSEDLTLCLVLA